MFLVLLKIIFLPCGGYRAWFVYRGHGFVSSSFFWGVFSFTQNQILGVEGIELCSYTEVMGLLLLVHRFFVCFRFYS